MNYWSVAGINVNKLKSNSIIAVVCSYYDLNALDLKTSSRRREVTEARFIIFYLLRQRTKLSLQAIGGRFNRHHSSVLHGIKKTKELREVDATFKKDYNSILARIT